MNEPPIGSVWEVLPGMSYAGRTLTVLHVTDTGVDVRFDGDDRSWNFSLDWFDPRCMRRIS